MKNNRRDFLKKAGLAEMDLAGDGIFNGIARAPRSNESDASNVNTNATMKNTNKYEDEISLIVSYGAWANEIATRGYVVQTGWIILVLSAGIFAVLLYGQYKSFC